MPFDIEIQHRLDFLDEYIDSLEHDKIAAGDNDLSVIEEAKEIHQKAREHYSKGDFKQAWTGIVWAEACILEVGAAELESTKKLFRKIDEALGTQI